MEITISFGNASIPKTERTGKGKSIIAFPSEYCVVDTETTGLSPAWDNIIEIGAVKYSNGVEVDRFQSLVQPSAYDDGTFVDDFIAELTGITNEMLSTAPQAAEAIKAFSEFLGDSVVVGYNVSFDMNFLYDNFVKHLGKPLTNDYIDAMRMARKLHPDMKHHRLRDMVELYKIVNEHEHRALADCVATAECFTKLHEEAIAQFETEEAFIKSYSHSAGGSGHWVRAADIQGDASKVDADNPLYNQHCVFTGKLEKFTRKEAMQIVADLGGINEDGVTKNTNFLILGNNDYCATIKDGKSTKQKKAEANKLKGQDIEIIPETVFYDMIGDTI